MKELLLKLAEQFNREAEEYHALGVSGQPSGLRCHWEGVARGLERAATVLTHEAWHIKGD